MPQLNSVPCTDMDGDGTDTGPDSTGTCTNSTGTGSNNAATITNNTDTADPPASGSNLDSEVKNLVETLIDALENFNNEG